jgi:hypothetical protein
LTKPVITIYNKPETEISAPQNEDKNVLSEGRAGVIGKRFTFDNGSITRVPEASTFQSLTGGQMQRIKEEIGLFEGGPAEVQKRKLSNQMEYCKQVEPIIEKDELSKHSDPRKLFENKPRAVLISVRGEPQEGLDFESPVACQRLESLQVTIGQP